MNDNIRYQNNGASVLSCEFVPGYISIKPAIRYNPEAPRHAGDSDDGSDAARGRGPTHRKGQGHTAAALAAAVRPRCVATALWSALGNRSATCS